MNVRTLCEPVALYTLRRRVEYRIIRLRNRSPVKFDPETRKGGEKRLFARYSKCVHVRTSPSALV